MRCFFSPPLSPNFPLPYLFLSRRSWAKLALCRCQLILLSDKQFRDGNSLLFAPNETRIRHFLCKLISAWIYFSFAGDLLGARLQLLDIRQCQNASNERRIVHGEFIISVLLHELRSDRIFHLRHSFWLPHDCERVVHFHHGHYRAENQGSGRAVHIEPGFAAVSALN